MSVGAKAASAELALPHCRGMARSEECSLAAQVSRLVKRWLWCSRITAGVARLTLEDPCYAGSDGNPCGEEED